MSGLDFKEKSIQAIRLTPMAYAQSGWTVRYVVFADPEHEDYRYEKVIHPPGVDVVRIQKPNWSVLATSNWLIQKLASKARTAVSIVRLAFAGLAEYRKGNYDVLYGYESCGILALAILRLMVWPKRALIVSRFQSVACVNLTLKRNGKLAAMLNHWQDFLAYYIPCHLCIMNNDGTGGDHLFKALRTPNSQKLKFWSNGVEMTSPPTEQPQRKILLQELGLQVPPRKHLIMTSCRLVDGKGLPRALHIIKELLSLDFTDFQYLIIGSGSLKEDLQQLAEQLGVCGHVSFISALPQTQITRLLMVVDAVLLTYEYSNVGNPLLEAIAARKVIFTLNTDYTKEWIEHGQDGYIFDVDGSTNREVARTIAKVLPDETICKEIQSNMDRGNGLKLWSWPERLKIEVDTVFQMLQEL